MSAPTFSSFPHVKLPYHSLGCPLEGFTAFHLINFLINSFLWHFSELLKLSRNLSLFIRRYQLRYPSLFFRQARTLQASQLVRAWTFLSQHRADRNYPKFAMLFNLDTMHIVSVVFQLRAKNTAFQVRETF